MTGIDVVVVTWKLDLARTMWRLANRRLGLADRAGSPKEIQRAADIEWKALQDLEVVLVEYHGGFGRVDGGE